MPRFTPVWSSAQQYNFVYTNVEDFEQETLGSNLGRDITAILTELFRSAPQSLQANVGIASRLGHDRFLQKFFFIDYSRIIIPFDAM
jgi:hypothetical protein